MVRTRKRFYGEEVSQSSSNIAYSGRSRLKQERKRTNTVAATSNKKAKKAMSEPLETETIDGSFAEEFLDLYERAVGGGVHEIGSVTNPRFWTKFAAYFSYSINQGRGSGEGKVNFTADECQEQGRRLHMRKGVIVVNHRYYERIKRVCHYKQPYLDIKSRSMKSQSSSKKYISQGTTSNSTGTSPLIFDSTAIAAIQPLEKQVIRHDVLRNLVESGGIGFSESRKVEDIFAHDEYMTNYFLLSDREGKKRIVKDLLQKP